MVGWRRVEKCFLESESKYLQQELDNLEILSPTQPLFRFETGVARVVHAPQPENPRS
jgi:hypothetical protein